MKLQSLSFKQALNFPGSSGTTSVLRAEDGWELYSDERGWRAEKDGKGFIIPAEDIRFGSYSVSTGKPAK